MSPMGSMSVHSITQAREQTQVVLLTLIFNPYISFPMLCFHMIHKSKLWRAIYYPLERRNRGTGNSTGVIIITSIDFSEITESGEFSKLSTDYIFFRYVRNKLKNALSKSQIFYDKLPCLGR